MKFVVVIFLINFGYFQESGKIFNVLAMFKAEAIVSYSKAKNLYTQTILLFVSQFPSRSSQDQVIISALLPVKTYK